MSITPNPDIEALEATKDAVITKVAEFMGGSADLNRKKAIHKVGGLLLKTLNGKLAVLYGQE